MDFLNKGLAQVAELFRSMTPAARVTAGLLLLVVVVSLGYLFNHQMAGPDDYLFGGEGVPVGLLPKMEGAFAKADLSSYQIEGSRIKVPRGLRAKYMAALVDGDAIPTTFNGFVEKAAQSNPFFGTTKEKREEVHRVAVQSELAMILRSMRGIENASVLVDSVAESNLSRKKTMTASVSVRPTGSARLEDDRVAGIRHLVAGAFAGLRPEDVVVTDLVANQTYVAENSTNNPGGTSDLYVRMKRLHEREWEEKVARHLAYIPGVTITANVELSTDLESIRQSTKFDPKTVPIRREERTQNHTSTSGTPGGRPGVVANGPNSPAALSQGGNTSQNTEEKTDTVEQNLAPSTTEFIKTAPLVPKEVFVIVGVPNSYLEQIYRERNPTPAGQPAKRPDQAALAAIGTDAEVKIQKQVAGLFPPETRIKLDRVTVNTFADPVREPMPTPTFADHAMLWLGQYWGTLGMGFLGMFGMVTLRSMVRSAGSGQPVVNATTTTAASTEPTRSDEETATHETNENNPEVPAKKRRRLATGTATRDELVEIVRDNPDAAANILRTWIGSGT